MFGIFYFKYYKITSTNFSTENIYGNRLDDAHLVCEVKRKVQFREIQFFYCHFLAYLGEVCINQTKAKRIEPLCLKFWK